MKAVKVVLVDTVLKSANFVSTRIVLAIKEYKTEEEQWKARIVVQSCMDRDSLHIVSDAGCVASMSVCVLLILGFSREYSIRTRDFKQTYLQGRHLTRRIYARYPKKMKRHLREYLLWILSPIYGIREAGSY